MPLIKLANFYGVTADYLLGLSRTEITQTLIFQTCV